MDDSFKNQIESANSILVLLPQNPDFDNVASGLSLYLALLGTKDISIVCSTPMRVEFNRLVGVNKITTDLGNKNLVLRIADYNASDIERVSYDIENGQFKLTVIPKPTLAPPKKEQVVFSYSGVAADLVILISGKSKADFPALASKDLEGVNIMHIGINSLADIEAMSFAKAASSTSEAVATTLKSAGFEFDPDNATNLVMGIDEGSQGYSGDGVTADTFQIVADLMRAGGRRVAKSKMVNPQAFPPGAIPGMMPNQPQRTVVTANPQPMAEDMEAYDDEGTAEAGETPTAWTQPKIYKGTSVS